MNGKISRCSGEGQGSCKRCDDNGKWNRMWTCFLYHIEGMEGCYCSDCVKAILGDDAFAKDVKDSTELSGGHMW